jgi:poly-gamma-glutamate synthesis protein (capsule biosynthesis protein)
MSNYPLSYRLSWLPRFLKPSLGGNARGFASSGGMLLASPPKRTARLAFLGDISAVANNRAPAVDPAIRALLSSADLVLGNCESPVVEKPRAALRTVLGTHHAMTGRFLAEALEAAGIAPDRLVLSLANNHALDQGTEGFAETLATLDRLGIRTIGTRAAAPVERVMIEGVTIGFGAFTLWRNAGEAQFSECVSMEADPERWPPDAASGVDLLCAMPHCDWEFRHFPRPETRNLARRLSGQGFGLVVGGHAHVVQPVEWLDATLVSYCLGDFFGTAFAHQPWPGRIGGILSVDVSADADTRGAIAAYAMRFFFRLRDGRRERLVPVEALTGPLRAKVEARIDAVFRAAL